MFSRQLWIELPATAFVIGVLIGLRPGIDGRLVYLLVGAAAIQLLSWTRSTRRPPETPGTHDVRSSLRRLIRAH